MAIPGGTPIGSVVVEEKLQSSAAEELYLARQPGLGRRVLLRKLRGDLGPAALERFLREARLASRVVHPNVLQIHDLFAVRGEHWLVSEYLDGISLAIALESPHPVPARPAACLALELARGLAEVHARGIVHGDPRPENVWLGRWGEVKLGGFGRAREAGDPDPPPPEPLPAPWGAPEVAREGRVTPQADAYAFGALLGLLARRRGQTRARRRGPLPAHALARLAARMTQEDPDARPTLAEAAQHLLQLVPRAEPGDCRLEVTTWLWEVRLLRGRGAPTSSAPPESEERAVAEEAPPPPRRPRRRALQWMPVAAGLAGVALAGGLWAVTRVEDPDSALAPVSAAPPSAPARVRFVAHPWAEIRVDEGTPFLTPRASRLELAPGTHRVEFRHPTLGVARLELRLDAGEERTVRHVFGPGGAP